MLHVLVQFVEVHGAVCHGSCMLPVVHQGRRNLIGPSTVRTRRGFRQKPVHPDERAGVGQRALSN
eukprot:7265771-Pyramimonas_sp.AAC.1